MVKIKSRAWHGMPLTFSCVWLCLLSCRLAFNKLHGKDVLKHKRPITEGHIKGAMKGEKSDTSSRPNPPPPMRR